MEDAGGGELGRWGIPSRNPTNEPPTYLVERQIEQTQHSSWVIPQDGSELGDRDVPGQPFEICIGDTALGHFFLFGQQAKVSGFHEPNTGDGETEMMGWRKTYQAHAELVVQPALLQDP